MSSRSALYGILKCLGHCGGSKSKQALKECLNKPEIEVGGHRVSVYDFLRYDCGLEAFEALQAIVKCLRCDGGFQNKNAFKECFSKPEINFKGKKVSVYKFLQLGCGFTNSHALNIILKCTGQPGGANNKKAFIEFLVKPEIDLNEKKVSLYEFLCSERGGGFPSSDVIWIFVKCIGHTGGLKNKQSFITAFTIKFPAPNGGLTTLFDRFLSVAMLPKQAITLSLIFSFYRSCLDFKCVLQLFVVKNEQTVADLLKSLNISCYETLLMLATQIIRYKNSLSKFKKNQFSICCDSLIQVFLSPDSYFNKKMRECPDWSATILGGKCIDACILFSGKSINQDLYEREKLMVNCMQRLSFEYQLTKEGLDIITHVPCIETLKELMALSNRELGKKSPEELEADDFEDSLKDVLQVFLRAGRATIQALLRYGPTLLSWFDLKEISRYIMGWWNYPRIASSICYFFENQPEIKALMSTVDDKKSFVAYMGLSAKSHSSCIPLKVARMKDFFQILGEEMRDYIFENPCDSLFPLYSIYCVLPKEIRFQTMMEGIPKMFGSYSLFQSRYQSAMKEGDWLLLSKLIEKWDPEKNNLASEEFSFLLRIRYCFPKRFWINYQDAIRFEDCREGCRVLNHTVYPDWVFALSYVQQIEDLLEVDCNVLVQENKVVFESFNDIDIRTFSFPLFKISLCKGGFMFEGERVSSLMCFFERAGFVENLFFFQDDNTQSEEMLSQRQKRSKNKTDTPSSLKTQVGGARARKRRLENPESNAPFRKKLKPLASQEVKDLYETVSRRDILTATNCALFLKGKSYLSDKMIGVLSKKTPAFQSGYEEIILEWQRFIEDYYEKRLEDDFMRLELPDELLWETQFLSSTSEDNDPNVLSPMLPTLPNFMSFDLEEFNFVYKDINLEIERFLI